MSVSDDSVVWALELFEPLGDISTRKMMGGLCLYHEAQIFAIISSDGTLFLKAKGAFAETLAATGARQFGADGTQKMGYWTMPDDGLDDPEAATAWARQALENL